MSRFRPRIAERLREYWESDGRLRSSRGGALLSIDVENDFAAVKHNRPVTEVERSGDHHRGQRQLAHYFPGQFHDKLAGPWIERGRVLVEQKHVRFSGS
jgi:hypothetical protein